MVSRHPFKLCIEAPESPRFKKTFSLATSRDGIMILCIKTTIKSKLSFRICKIFTDFSPTGLDDCWKLKPLTLPVLVPEHNFPVPASLRPSAPGVRSTHSVQSAMQQMKDDSQFVTLAIEVECSGRKWFTLKHLEKFYSDWTIFLISVLSISICTCRSMCIYIYICVYTCVCVCVSV